ncbi:MAG: fibronectin type III domain-containing protein [Clostridia bacterium]|nr:fibronectin type III domain-containing protein [Clostridia bacterium]
MKKTTAMVLAAILLLAVIPAAQAEKTDYTVVIPGGETSAYMTELDGGPALRVDVYFEGVTDDKLLTALSFDLGFETDKLEYVTDSQTQDGSSLYAVDAEGNDVGERSLLISTRNTPQGSLRFVLGSDYGCRIRDGEPLVSLYFYIAAGQEAGTTLSFTLGGEIEAESVRMEDQTLNARYVQRTVGSDMTPYTLSEGDAGSEIDAMIEFNPADVKYKGTTPYVIRDGKPKTPRVTVKDAETGETIDPAFYRLTYQNNVEAGTAFVTASFLNGYAGKASRMFKIYLPATKWTKVENTADGVCVTWDAVEGAGGYVIYRRAWNRQSSDWTSFARWNNTKGTAWVDAKVYAGTRYQYGVKAYPSDPMDNYNLGVVGPLRTTVRITTRTLESVTAGSKKMTIKWSASKNFTGYEIRYSTNAEFASSVRTIRITDPKTCETVVRGLTTKKIYYVQVRSYQLFEGMEYFGGWSNMKFCKIN